MLPSLAVDLFVGVVVTLASAFISWKVNGVANTIQNEIDRGRKNEVRSVMNRIVIRKLHDIQERLPPEEDDAMDGDAEISMQEVLDARLEEVGDDAD